MVYSETETLIIFVPKSLWIFSRLFLWGIKKFTDFFPFALFQSLFNSLSTTTWHFEWEGVTIHQIKMHIQMPFNVQCTLKASLRNYMAQLYNVILALRHFITIELPTLICLFLSSLPISLLQDQKVLFLCINGTVGKLLLKRAQFGSLSFQ